MCVCVCVCYGGIGVTTIDDNQTATTDADTTLIAAIVGGVVGLIVVALVVVVLIAVSFKWKNRTKIGIIIRCICIHESNGVVSVLAYIEYVLLYYIFIMVSIHTSCMCRYSSF